MTNIDKSYFLYVVTIISKGLPKDFQRKTTIHTEVLMKELPYPHIFCLLKLTKPEKFNNINHMVYKGH